MDRSGLQLKRAMFLSDGSHPLQSLQQTAIKQLRPDKEEEEEEEKANRDVEKHHMECLE